MVGAKGGECLWHLLGVCALLLMDPRGPNFGRKGIVCRVCLIAECVGHNHNVSSVYHSQVKVRLVLFLLFVG